MGSPVENKETYRISARLFVVIQIFPLLCKGRHTQSHLHTHSTINYLNSRTRWAI